MSSCLSGAGGRTYGFDFEFVKSPSSSTRTSHTSSSPSSTISESSNSALAISTRKPRTPRKRPNQTYNEAAALLSTAYPNLFSTKNLKTHAKFSKPAFDYDSSELLLPFTVLETSSSCFLLEQPMQRHKPMEPKVVNVQEKPCQSPGEISSRVNSIELNDDCEESFDAESILDEEIGEGIDSIMGSRVQEDDSNDAIPWTAFGGKLDFRVGFPRPGIRALRHVDDGNWWNFPAVDILQISPKVSNKPPPLAAEKKNKKKKKVEKPVVELNTAELPKPKQGLMLKLNYDGVQNAWSDRGSPFAADSPVSDAPENDVTARLSQIDLLWDNGGVREASVLRYKEKRRTRLFSKKIRYQVRKVNADRRPRMKGRFVRRLNSSSNAHR
ncbi:protein CHLOROPLAST IMPORT APPARATUS 2 isoform X2 [Abrus precatorius]|uniref:Protein CHLOROPLAST IMPORT APPARATUS 2 isoform X2 n=1 Tax=Abrus precatorius TaxID=3816 RepID=A0A8B8JD93_ABRPR|nr:protein CHLOROPLAST IMPORT APPARATUS 2 isoform X2 [Abrus precatorius]XP_027329160.1 protein CHLOROPLAST IMPORT APPARATUS 2 isoform X2 [Abrus precatorius]